MTFKYFGSVRRNFFYFALKHIYFMAEYDEFLEGLDDWFEEFTNDFEFDSILTTDSQNKPSTDPVYPSAYFTTPTISSDLLTSEYVKSEFAKAVGLNNTNTPLKQYPKLLPKQQPTPSALHQLRENQVKQTITSLPLDFVPKKLAFKKMPKKCTGHLVFYTLYTDYFQQKMADMGKKEFGKMMAQIYKDLPQVQRDLFEKYAISFNDGKFRIDENGLATLLEEIAPPTSLQIRTPRPSLVEKRPSKDKKKRKRDLIPENYVCKMSFGNVPVKRRRIDASSEVASSEIFSSKSLPLSSDKPSHGKEISFLSSDVPEAFSEFKEDAIENLPTTPIKPIKLCYAEIPTTPTKSPRRNNLIKTPTKPNNYSKTIQTVQSENLENILPKPGRYSDKATQVSPIKPKVLVPRKYRQVGDEENFLQ
eukprot:NODE_86_length_22075_cov_1.190253.p6 type:complete len:419 gc:universal NODE_86_length_22075_cov_1.190253:16652-15396(-)